MSIKIVTEEDKVYAHLHNRNDIFMARVQIPEEIDYKCHTTLYEYLKEHHGPLLKRVR